MKGSFIETLVREALIKGAAMNAAGASLNVIGSDESVSELRAALASKNTNVLLELGINELPDGRWQQIIEFSTVDGKGKLERVYGLEKLEAEAVESGCKGCGIEHGGEQMTGFALPLPAFSANGQPAHVNLLIDAAMVAAEQGQHDAVFKYADRMKQWEDEEFKFQFPEPSKPMLDHADDQAVDQFAEYMKTKLAQCRTKGYSGWQTCPTVNLVNGLHKAMAEHDIIDIANYLMMLHLRGDVIAFLPESLKPVFTAPQFVQDLKAILKYATWEKAKSPDDAQAFARLAAFVNPYPA